MEKPKSETPEILSGCAPALVFLLWRVKYHPVVLFQSVACGWFEAIQCILLERSFRDTSEKSHLQFIAIDEHGSFIPKLYQRN